MSGPSDAVVAVPARWWSAPGGVVVQRTSDGRVAFLGPEDAQAWTAARRPLIPAPADAPRFARLVAAGLLEPVDAIRRRLVPDRTLPGVDRVCVPTRGPSAMLTRALDSLVRGSVPVRVYVDDPDPAAADAVRARGDVEVVGANERAAYAKALAGACDPAAVDAVLAARPGPWRVGALRNLILLQNVGRVVVSVDDDVVAEAITAPPAPAALTAEDPVAWSFFGSRAEAWAGAAPIDLASAHGAVLGGSAAAAWSGGAAERATTDLLATVHDARVVVTTTGLAGDVAIERASFGIGFAPEKRERFLADYEGHLASRAVRRASPCVALTELAPLLAFCLGLDGRALLPPFFTSYRNTDGVWNRVLASIQAGLVAYLPIAVRHDPAGDRRQGRAEFVRDAVRFRWSDFATVWISRFRPRGATVEARLASLAHAVGALATDPALADVVDDVCRTWLAGIAGLADRARRAGGPVPWLEDLARVERLAADGLLRPPGPEEHVRDGVLDVPTLREDLARFALALDAWPRVRAAAAATGS